MWRRLSILLFAVVAASLASGVDNRGQNGKVEKREAPLVNAPGVPPVSRLNVDVHVRLANQHLATNYYDPQSKHYRDEVQFVRFVSWYAVPEKVLEDEQKVFRVWLTGHLSSGPDRVFPVPVTGSFNRLWALDLRDYRWNAAAWRAVALREPFFVEPLVHDREAEFLRRVLGEKQEAKTLHVLGVVRADWLMRDTMESNRSTSYYDLLFAENRFVQTVATPARTVTQVVTEDVPRTEDVYDAVTKQFVKKTTVDKVNKTKKVEVPAQPGGVKLVDFPKDEKDWNQFFGIDDVQKFLARQKINVESGAIVAGSKDDPVRGSIVARNNRVVFMLPIPTGVALKTFDTDKTANDTDYLEQSPEVQQLIAVGKLKFQAGELLATLPAGGQAGLLINGEGKRIEKADTEFAHNKADNRYVDVRTMMGCVTCHSVSGGFIVPKDLVKDFLLAGVDVKIKDRAERNKFRAFFLDWDDKVTEWQRPYNKMLWVATRNEANPQDKGWDGPTFVSKFLAARNRYDDAMTTTQMAREAGLSEPLLRLVASKSPKVRINLIAVGQGIPREVWDVQTYKEVGLLLDSLREDPGVAKELKGLEALK